MTEPDLARLAFGRRPPEGAPLPEPAGPYGPDERRALFGERPPREGAGVEISGPKALLDAMCAWEHRHRCCVCGAVDAPWWCGEGTAERPHQRLCTADAARVAQPSQLVIRGADDDTEDLVLPGFAGVRVWHESEHPPDASEAPLSDLPPWAQALLAGAWVLPPGSSERGALYRLARRGVLEARRETREERLARGAHKGAAAQLYRVLPGREGEARAFAAASVRARG